jgi:hypothetical protein
MKSINRIVLLTLAAVAIVMFWLIPGINQATTLEYTRIYEDTDYRESILTKDTTKKEKAPKPPKGPGRPEDEIGKKSKAPTKVKDKAEKVMEEKVKKANGNEEKMMEEKVKDDGASASVKPSRKYKRESIRPKDKNFKLEAKMFSRAVQFVEEVELDSAKVVAKDSVASKPNL